MPFLPWKKKEKKRRKTGRRDFGCRVAVSDLRGSSLFVLLDGVQNLNSDRCCLFPVMGCVGKFMVMDKT